MDRDQGPSWTNFMLEAMPDSESDGEGNDDIYGKENDSGRSRTRVGKDGGGDKAEDVRR